VNEQELVERGPYRWASVCVCVSLYSSVFIVCLVEHTKYKMTSSTYNLYNLYNHTHKHSIMYP